MPPCKLPPLILHPFSDASGPAKLADATRAGLLLHDMAAGDEASALERRLLEGRYCEVSMLFYLGKDLLRWMSQCCEFAERTMEQSCAELRPESFGVLLIDDAPREVAEKLRSWGVFEFKNIFARALGLHAIFESLPPRGLLASDFLRYYHRFADHMYACHQQLFRFRRLRASDFEFQLYASGEYSNLLEREWGTEL